MTTTGRTMRCAAAALAAGALALAPAAGAQKLYKWTDEKGVVHYTDTAPDKAGGVVLDKQGRPLRAIEAPLTPDQAKAAAVEAEKQKAIAKEQEAANRRDRALMSSYTTEAEIDLAKARASATYESQIQSAQAYMAQLTRRKQEIDARKARFVDKPVPAQLEAESATVNSEYAKNQDLVAQKRRDLAAVVARYDADKARWRELKAVEASNAAAQSSGRVPTPVAGTPKM
jgi:hypothetical protein